MDLEVMKMLWGGKVPPQSKNSVTVPYSFIRAKFVDGFLPPNF